MGAIVSSAKVACSEDDTDALKSDPDLQPDTFPKTDGHTIEVSLNDGGEDETIKGDVNTKNDSNIKCDQAQRTIGYAMYGSPLDEASDVILFFHGTPGTRFFFSQTHSDYAAARGACVLVPERGGYGLSTSYKGRTLQSSACDARRLLEALNVVTMKKDIYIIGYSAGGPVALAFAHDYPQLCKSVAIVSSLSPNERGVLQGSDILSKIGYTLATHSASLLTFLVSWMSHDMKKTARDKNRHDLSPEENEIYQRDDDIRRVFSKSILELYARDSGAREEAWDYILMARPWGFDLGDIRGDFQIWVYGGALDFKCTMAMYHLLVKSLPSHMVKSVLEQQGTHLLFYDLFTGRLFDDLGVSRSLSRPHEMI